MDLNYQSEAAIPGYMKIIPIIIILVIFAVIITLIVLVIRALLKYLKSNDVRKEKVESRKSLGEALREHRTQCRMTQEFVAETLGVSRQSISKWENGTSDPSTSNLLAIAKVYGITAEELIRGVESQSQS